jgi:hypothetical protein
MNLNSGLIVSKQSCHLVSLFPFKYALTNTILVKALFKKYGKTKLTTYIIEYNTNKMFFKVTNNFRFALKS